MQEAKWATDFLSMQAQKKIESELKSIEAKTHAEIVLVIAQTSTTTGHVFPLLWSLLLLASWLGVFELLLIFDLSGMYEILGYCLSLIFTFFLAFGLSRIALVQRLLTHRFDESWSVDRQAELQFYRRKISETRDRAGVLVYTSLMERRAVLLADRNSKPVLTQNVIDQTLQQFLQNLRQNRAEEGFLQLLAELGGLLQSSLPVKADDANELPNELVFIEGPKTPLF